MNKNILFRLIPCFFLFVHFLNAQPMIRTDHFHIYYSPGAEGTARRVADVAEEVYAPLASAFDAFDDVGLVYVYVHDETDVSNGYASYSQNKVEIWASDLDFELRGTSNWIKNVMTHELAHIFSLKKAKNGWLDFGVLTFGRYNVNPDYVFEIPYYHLNVPSWYAEGIAQYSALKQGNDAWDTHRDMLLRMAAIENDLLSYEQMGVFTRDGLHSEMVYNQGFALVQYINHKYGEGKAEALTHHTNPLTFDVAIQKTLKTKPVLLYENWKTDLIRGYEQTLTRYLSAATSNPSPLEKWPAYQHNPEALAESALTSGSIEGDLVIDGGFMDAFPALSPDGHQIAYISNEGSDYALTDLYVYDVKTGKSKKLIEGVRSRVSWTPDGKNLVYVRRKEMFNDLFMVDVQTKKEKRLSRNLRAKDPSVSPDGKTIAFVRNEDGSANLALVDNDGSHIRMLTAFNDGTQIFSPSWSPGGKRIAFSIFREKDRDIGVIDADAPCFRKKSDTPDSLAMVDTSGFDILIHSSADERDPQWLSDGSGLIFSSDRDGIFNLYEYSLGGKTVKRSLVLGGAFSPSLSADGNVMVYAGYHAANFNIYRLERGLFEEPVQFKPVDREYLRIYTGKTLDELYQKSYASTRLVLLGATPILNLSPNFIGNKFTINTINVGAEIAIGDLWGENYFVGTGMVGRSLKNADKLDLNYTLSGYYQQRLPSILTEDRNLAPTGYVFGDKRIIHDFDETSQTLKQTQYADLFLYYPDNSVDTLENVEIRYDLKLEECYRHRLDFFQYGCGIRLPITRRQQAQFGYIRRDYHWREKYNYKYSDLTEYVYQGEKLQLNNGRPYTETSQTTVFDANFFRSHDYFIHWRYLKMKPSADAIINPRGVRLLSLGITRSTITVTDSLHFLGQDANPAYAPHFASFSYNEFVFNWLEIFKLPVRQHSLGIETRVWFMDKRIPERDELINIDGYFPLRMYLGGFNTLRGYPYFTQTGSQLYFNRIKYTFPVFKHIDKQILHLTLDRLYASVFLETGTMLNSRKLSYDAIENSDWLHDAGFELRLSTFSFYRIPCTAYVMAAWPVDEITDELTGKTIISHEDKRVYFGFQLGGSY